MELQTAFHLLQLQPTKLLMIHFHPSFADCLPDETSCTALSNTPAVPTTHNG
jgi:hypothetical protein